MIDMHLLHAGGVTVALDIPREWAERAVARLMTCTEHTASHVFVVDQSNAKTVRLGVSEHGRNRLHTWMAEEMTGDHP